MLNPRKIKYILTTICLIVCISVTLVAQTTYYSSLELGATDDWNLNTSWTLNSDGSGSAAGVPGRDDHVVILSGATIVINNTNDNGSTGVLPDNLNRPNVGGFNDSGQSHFYQIGNITVQASGTLQSNVRTMLEGYVSVEGTFSTTNDIVNLGQIYIAPLSTFYTGDDFVLSGSSRTTIDEDINNGDDLYIDHTDARLCGTGSLGLGLMDPNNGPTDILYFNSASINQICSGFGISCVNPDASDCDPVFPEIGSGGFSIDLSDFNYSKTFTINSGQVTGDLTDFPVLINYTDASISTGSGGVENANGYDIIFATSSSCGSLTQLDHQLESYDGTSGNLVAWVKVPFVSSSTDTDIFMYYGNAAVTDDISVKSTFDDDYIAIWHMNEDPGSGNMQDATYNSHIATQNGGMSGNVTGPLGNAVEFDGGDDYLQTDSDELATENNFTVSAWILASQTTVSHIIWQGDVAGNGWGDSQQEMHFSLGDCCPDSNGDMLVDNEVSFFLGNTEDEDQEEILQIGTTGGPFSPFNDNSNWNFIAATITDMAGSPVTELFLNGQSVGTDPGTAGSAFIARNNWNTDMRFGRPGPATRFYMGQLDEVRLSSIVRSAAWILTEYNNQSDPSTFFTVSSEPGSINLCGPLPIELLYFKGSTEGNSVVLTWATASELNNDYFTIERSFDGRTFQNVAEIAGAGNSKTKLDYSYLDKDPGKGYIYYRLKQTDYDGQFSYSRLISVNLDVTAPADLSIYPNPNNGTFQITSSSIYDKNLSLRIYNTSGKLMKTATIVNDYHYLDTYFDASGLPKGVYYLSLNSSVGSFVKKLVIE